MVFLSPKNPYKSTILNNSGKILFDQYVYYDNCDLTLILILKEIMKKKQAKQKIEEINKLSKEEKKFAKSLFLYRYYVGLASK